MRTSQQTQPTTGFGRKGLGTVVALDGKVVIRATFSDQSASLIKVF